jgi:excinuclease ABC subunit C
VVSEQLAAKLSTLPTVPGVYIYKDVTGRIIYVGKAVSLRSRVRSYFQDAAGLTAKTRRLVAEISDLDFIVTDSEIEALILECNLIKQHRPRFNVRLKDDKRYPYIKVNWQNPFPKIEITRRMLRDGARYYGPFANSWAVVQTLDTLRKIFPYLTCDRVITGKDPSPCLYYHIKRCSGPCIGAISQEKYRRDIDQICMVLEGKSEQALELLHDRMVDASDRLDYERAALFRDRIEALQRVIERQRVVSMAGEDQDVIAFAREDGDACVQIFFIREGKLLGREYFLLDGVGEEPPKEILGSFVQQFYDEAAYIPPEILVETSVEEKLILQEWLARKRGAHVRLTVPRNPDKKALVEMAAQNAAETLAHLRAQWISDESHNLKALTDLQQALGLPEPPNRIECYDISNIQGTSATGSMAVFVKGTPRKSDYRKFRIKYTQGPDDFAMMAEVIRRRFKHLLEPHETTSAPGARVDSFALKPDLIILDGGKGQLSAATAVLKDLGITDVYAAALAKEREEIFLPGRSQPIILPAGTQALFLVQRIRDEAHRFAVEYHRTVRTKRGLASRLDEVPGIGPRRRQALLKHFGSLEAIRDATIEDLVAVPGITRDVAEKLKQNL